MVQIDVDAKRENNYCIELLFHLTKFETYRSKMS